MVEEGMAFPSEDGFSTGQATYCNVGQEVEKSFCKIEVKFFWHLISPVAWDVLQIEDYLY